ncbi:type IV pilus assembly protein PilM [Candidatus Parcubacteria bacterium]|nr:type IV pilus assembly protein PilM [Patescibacteria group bacterium]MCG2694270.1 type IV pilus assembly protein PilM [Candidatus Parcubacteria bacterium]
MAKSQNYLGVDIGASGIKLVEIANVGGRARLVTYGFSEYSEMQPISQIIANTAEKAKELASLYKQSGATAKMAITGLPMSSVFTTLLTLSNIPPKRLETEIKNKIKKLAPIPEDDLVLDFKKVEMKDMPPGVIKISATAASKKMISKYLEIFKLAGLQLASLETESFALIRSLLGKDMGLSAIVDIGAIKTNILIVKEGVPVIHRTIKIGGAELTENLAEKMKTDLMKAEEIKRAMSMEKMESAHSLFDSMVKSIANEVNYCKELYSEQYNHAIIEKIVLTGGTAMILGIGNSLESATGLRVFYGDPWTRIIYPEDLRPPLDAIGARFAVAIGLAMREII